MNKKVLKIVTILTLVFLVVATLAIPAFADEDYSQMGTSINTTKFDNEGDSSGASNSVGRIVGAILNIVRVVAVGVAVIMLIVLAIKYISSAPNDKAEIKKHAVVYVVGAVLLFSAAGVLGIIQKFAGNVKAD